MDGASIFPVAANILHMRSPPAVGSAALPRRLYQDTIPAVRAEAGIGGWGGVADMTLAVCSLASGSSGNATYVSTGRTSVLVDCGASAREVVLRLSPDRDGTVGGWTES